MKGSIARLSLQLRLLLSELHTWVDLVARGLEGALRARVVLVLARRPQVLALAVGEGQAVDCFLHNVALVLAVVGILRIHDQWLLDQQVAEALLAEGTSTERNDC